MKAIHFSERLRLAGASAVLLLNVACSSSGGSDGQGTPLVASVASQTPQQSSWISYVGSHYETRSWAGSVRDPGGVRQVGYDAADPAGSLATFNSTLTNNIVPLLPSYYQVLSVGGLGSGHDPVEVSTFMGAIALDSAAGFRDGIYQRAKAVAAFNGAVAKVYWQLGNEVNSQKFSENLHLWAGDGAAPDADDISTIPWLVEYFMAPAAEGVRQAAQELFADPGRIHLVSGSVVTAGSVKNDAFMNALLDYQITGTFAPSLAGKHVYDIVDTVSIHYTVGSPDWRTVLDGLYTDRIGPGKNIQGVFSTEEVGQGNAEAGYGMSTAVRVLARYMDWWIEHNITPDRGHVFFWGTGLGPSGTTVDELLPTLFGFLGDVALSRPTNISSAAGGANLEYYEYESASQHRRILSVFSADSSTATTLNSITVNVTGWNNLAVTGHFYTSTGDQAVTPLLTQQPDGTYLLTFIGTLTINPRESLLLLLQE